MELTLDQIAARLFVRPGSAVLDIGANQGESAALYLEQGASRVIAFEPRAAARAAFHPSLRADPRLDLLPYALSDRVGDVTMYTPRRNAGGSSISRDFFMRMRRDDADEGTTETVECRRVDDLDLPRADFWKIDAEGAELEILKGAAATLAERPPSAVQVEIFPHDPVRYAATLNLLGAAFPHLWAAGFSADGRLVIYPITSEAVESKSLHDDLRRSGTPRYFA